MSPELRTKVFEDAAQGTAQALKAYVTDPGRKISVVHIAHGIEALFKAGDVDTIANLALLTADDPKLAHALGKKLYEISSQYTQSGSSTYHASCEAAYHTAHEDAPDDPLVLRPDFEESGENYKVSVAKLAHALEKLARALEGGSHAYRKLCQGLAAGACEAIEIGRGNPLEDIAPTLVEHGCFYTLVKMATDAVSDVKESMGLSEETFDAYLEGLVGGTLKGFELIKNKFPLPYNEKQFSDATYFAMYCFKSESPYKPVIQYAGDALAYVLCAANTEDSRKVLLRMEATDDGAQLAQVMSGERLYRERTMQRSATRANTRQNVLN